MRVLVIGSGGREQAIAWACEQHDHTVTIATELGDVTSADVDLVIPGPESALVSGITDECHFRKIPCFGPTSKQARIESSKGYSRHLATALGVPGPDYQRFDHLDSEVAIDWWRSFGKPVVVKQDGLAAGKGVTVPSDDAETEQAIRETAKLGPFVLEERLSGPECSLLALCDGTAAVALPLAQDHKRIGEGDTGPNTGGMGAYAPAPVPYDPNDLVRTFVKPILDYYASVGTPYVGVLYAGLMLTADGPRLIEYNCRFGDPEAQAVLPLLESDLAELALACTQGAIKGRLLAVRSGAACTVVAAAPGYPGDPHKGSPIELDGFSTTEWPTDQPSFPRRFCSRLPLSKAVPQAGACSPSPVSVMISPPPARPPIAAWTGSSSRTCKSGVTSAGERLERCSRRMRRPVSTSTKATAPSTR